MVVCILQEGCGALEVSELSPIPRMPLEQELQTFHEQKEHLLEKYKDRYVLIKGDDVVADIESRGDALREGYKRFGHEAFLVKKVEEVEQVNFLSTALVD
jgi:hypothetical protein